MSATRVTAAIPAGVDTTAPGSGTLDVALAGAVQAGDVVVALYRSGDASVATMSDSLSSITWQTAKNKTAVVAGHNVVIVTGLVNSGGTPTIKFNLGASTATFRCAFEIWRGLTDAVIDKFASDNQNFNGTTFLPQASTGLLGTLTQADELILAAVAWADGKSSVAGSGFTLGLNVVDKIITEYQIVSATTSIPATWGNPGSGPDDEWATLGISLKIAGAGAAFPPELMAAASHVYVVP
jgi:hypothetical protein